jgi:hypothetical protein
MRHWSAMLIVALSDQHGFRADIPPCDLVIVAGDVCPDRFGPSMAVHDPVSGPSAMAGSGRGWRLPQPRTSCSVGETTTGVVKPADFARTRRRTRGRRTFRSSRMRRPRHPLPLAAAGRYRSDTGDALVVGAPQIWQHDVKRRPSELVVSRGHGPILHLEIDLHQVIEGARTVKRRWAFTLSNAGVVFFADRRELLPGGRIEAETRTNLGRLYIA